MHSYSLDTAIRTKVVVWSVLVSLGVVNLWPTLMKSLQAVSGLGEQHAYSLTFGTVFGLVYAAVEHWLWRAPGLRKVIGVPVLAGRWTAAGVSSFIGPDGKPFQFTMDVVIKQTFSRLEVYTKTGESTSRSVLAGVYVDHAVPIFRYAFENAPMSMANPELQRHPGLVELHVHSADGMSGDYFSGKHRLRTGSLVMTRVQESQKAKGEQ